MRQRVRWKSTQCRAVMSVRDVMSIARHNSTVMFEAHASSSAVVMASGEDEISRGAAER
jgi:hypothetical protein